MSDGAGRRGAFAGLPGFDAGKDATVAPAVRVTMGGAAFFEAGQVFADTHPYPELDGTGIGLEYGLGVGLRLSRGTAFVLRGDPAWSPDANPISSPQ